MAALPLWGQQRTPPPAWCRSWPQALREHGLLKLGDAPGQEDRVLDSREPRSAEARRFAREAVASSSPARPASRALHPVAPRAPADFSTPGSGREEDAASEPSRGDRCVRSRRRRARGGRGELRRRPPPPGGASVRTGPRQGAGTCHPAPSRRAFRSHDLDY